MTDIDARRLGEIVETQLGLLLEPSAAAAVLERRGRAGLLAKLEADPAAVVDYAAELTIGETYFFRHAEQLAAFRHVALPDRLAANADVVRMLSAGCSSGEEPYTLAIIAHEDRADRVRIDALDVNAGALEKARKARYSRWSLRSTPLEIERRWFVREGSQLALAPVIRGAVSFARANLADPEARALPVGRYDVVFCRNVLMYFGADALRETVARLARTLVPGGYLFLGHAEILREPPPGLSLCESHGTFYYRNGPRIAAPAETWPATDPSWFASIHAASERVRSLAEQAASVPPEVVVDPLVAARAAIAREDYAGALALLDAGPARGEAALLRAIALTEHGDAVRATTACEELLASPEHAAHAHYLLAVGRESAGDLASAARHARRATELAPELAMAHLRFGLIARRAGDRTNARRELARAIDALHVEPETRLALHAGGLGRAALIRLCRTELAAIAEDEP